MIPAVESLTKEYKSIFSKDGTTPDALKYFGLIGENDEIKDLIGASDLRRGGAETYVADSTVATETGENHFIVKHIVSSGGNIPKKVRNMLGTRANMVGKGFPAPKLFGASDSLFIEEYVPYDFDDVFTELNEQEKNNAVKNLIEIAARLDCYGINFDLYGQIRVNEQGDVFIVDFGSDTFLGDDENTKSTYGKALNNLKKFEVIMGDKDAMRKASSMSEYDKAKNVFNPDFAVEETYENAYKKFQEEKSISVEETFVMIKPEFAQHQNMVSAKFADAGLEVVNAVPSEISEEQAKIFYEEHEERGFYSDLIEYMTSGEVILMHVKGEDAVKAVRNIVGNTNPDKAEEGTIRQIIGESIQKNGIHASDSLKSAERELAFFGEELGLKPSSLMETDPAMPPRSTDNEKSHGMS